MRASDIKTVILSQFTRTNKVAYLLMSEPGAGKSQINRQIIASMGGNDDNTVEFNASTHDPVDVLGLPITEGNYARWLPPEEFYKLRDTPDDGPRFLNLEEMTDAEKPMQNALCRVVLDFMAGGLKLHHNLFILGSGNRTSDKSGANRLTTKLGNRMRQQTLDVNLDDWVQWAMTDGNIDPLQIMFHKYRNKIGKSSLSDFDPNRTINATPRSWASVNWIDTNLPKALYFAECAGTVGEGRAAEWVSFRDVYSSLISLEDVLMNPKGVKVPEELSALYATVGQLAAGVTLGNIDRMEDFLVRLPKEHSTMFYHDARQREPKLRATKPFIRWAADNANVIFN